MLIIRSYCETIIENLSMMMKKQVLNNPKALTEYSIMKVTCFELRKVCEKMNKATYLRGFDTKEHRINITHSMAVCMALYQQKFSDNVEKETGAYGQMIINTTMECIWKELIK